MSEGEIQNVNFFDQFSREELLELKELMRPSNYAKGELILSQSAVSDMMLCLLQGKVEIYKEFNDTKHTLAELSAGEVFGEIGLLTKRPRMANVKALTEVKALCLSRAGFQGLIKKRPDLACKFLLKIALQQCDRLSDLAKLLDKTTAEGKDSHSAVRELRYFRDTVLQQWGF